MKVLVTGANGMLGQDLCPIFEDAGMFIIKTSRANMDITDIKATEEFILSARPQVIVHAAAYTNVDGAQVDIKNALDVNYKATENLAKIAKKIDAVLIYISSDYVFDGTKNTPYLPSDATNPLSVYGMTKYLGEEAAKLAEKYYIARTSWLYGPHGKNFIETMIKLGQDENRELKVVNDQTGSPTYTVDLALGILKLLNKPYGTYHISGEGETTWYDFAKEIFALENLHPKLIPTSTEDYVKNQGAILAPKADRASILADKTSINQAPVDLAQNNTGTKLIAQRPKHSVLENSVPMRHWMEALRDYLSYRKSLI